MQNIWSKNFPDYVFKYNFIDQSIADYYKQENQLSALYQIFSGIGIFISCLGLYGLISFVAAGRTKEIGILIASPIAWYFINEWLQQYTYRISLSAGFFAVTIVASL